MACNCNKCNTSKNCGCNDSSLTTPCTYSDCGVGSERCADVQCAECVSYCGTTFQINTTDGLNTIRIESGERLDSIVQKFALILARGIGDCTADNKLHAPYNLFATDITSSQATIQWNNTSTATTILRVWYQEYTDPMNPGTILQAVEYNPFTNESNYILSSLFSSSTYRVYIQVLDGGLGDCQSVTIEFETLA